MAGRIGGVINYKIVGDGINVVFLHGWGGNASAFLFVAERLKSFCRSIVVDFNGFGDTPEPNRPYSVGDYAGEVLSVLEKEGVKKAIIVGHSFGGRFSPSLMGADKYMGGIRKIFKNTHLGKDGLTKELKFEDEEE